MTYDVVIQCVSGADVGARCILAQSVLVTDANHRFRDLSRPVLDQGMDVSRIRLGDDAAIMSKSTVLAGVGSRGFVAANAVGTRPVAANTVAAGVPAREIESFGPTSQDPLVAERIGPR
jgi:acetyltransferase-like isoleucine patch superfamily enzyme